MNFSDYITIDVFFMVISVILFLVSIKTKEGNWLSAIVMSEFLFSNSAAESLVKLDFDGEPWFQLMYTSLGVVYIFIAMFLSLFYLILKENKHNVVVSVLYFLAGIMFFLTVIQKTPINGEYFLNNLGVYENLEFIMSTICVLILITVGNNVAGGNGIINLYRMFSDNSGRNIFGVFSNKKCASGNGDKN